MRKIFDMDNPLMRGLSAAADLIVLNALALLCSLPLVTLGASWAALSEASLRLVRGEESYVARDYFRAFRARWKKGVPLGLLFLLAAALLYFDYLAALEYAPLMRPAIIAIALIASVGMPCRSRQSCSASVLIAVESMPMLSMRERSCMTVSRPRTMLPPPTTMPISSPAS